MASEDKYADFAWECVRLAELTDKELRSIFKHLPSKGWPRRPRSEMINSTSSNFLGERSGG
jgi:hypothetical protein